MRSDELRSKRDTLDSELAVLDAKGSTLNAGEREQWDRTLRARVKVNVDLERLEARNEQIAELMSRPGNREYAGVPTMMTDEGTRTGVNLAQAGALRSLEHNLGMLSSDQADRVEHLVRSSATDTAFARWTEVHGRSEYSWAFAKVCAAVMRARRR